jgi:lambda family phage minor tail protein L
MTLTDTNGKIANDIRKPEVGEVIALYTLDTTVLGGSTYYFTRNTDAGAAVVFNGITYLPIDFEFKENQYSQDTLPRPKFKIANVSLTLQAEILAYNNLLGSTLTRTRTLRKYLDGEPESDSSATFQPDVYLLHKKTSHNKLFIEWELRSPLDNYRTLIPKKQVLREVCQFHYRIYNGSGFTTDTSNPCPYTGTDYFDRDGNPTTIANDACRKRLSDCILRFGDSVDGVPFGGFPSVAKTRF